MEILKVVTIVIGITLFFSSSLITFLIWYFTKSGKNTTKSGLPKTSIDYLKDFEKSRWFHIVPILIFFVVAITVYLAILLLLR